MSDNRKLTIRHRVKVPTDLTLLVRSDTGLAELVHDIEEAVWSVDPGLPVRLQSLHGVVDAQDLGDDG